MVCRVRVGLEGEEMEILQSSYAHQGGGGGDSQFSCYVELDLASTVYRPPPPPQKKKKKISEVSGMHLNIIDS